jgi:adenine-specific DNA methylase
MAMVFQNTHTANNTKKYTIFYRQYSMYDFSRKSIFKVLEKYGKVELCEFEYLRFKSNSNGKSKTKKHIREQLYFE